jgi:hypothetical protein
MKRYLTVGLPALVLAALCTLPLWSDEGSDKGGGGMPETMMPGPENQALAKLAGKYEVAGKFWMQPGAPEIQSKGTAEMSSILDGRFVQQTYSGELMEMKYTGLGILGYDRVIKKYTQHWADNMSTNATFLYGTSKDGGKTIEFKGKMSEPESGGEVETRWVHTTKSDDQFTFEMYTGPADKEHKVMELTYTRRK